MIWLCGCPNDWGSVRPLMTSSGRVVLICDEADDVWLHPNDIADPDAVIYPSAPDWTVTEGVSVAPGTTRWATLADVADLDWEVEWRDGSTPIDETATSEPGQDQASAQAPTAHSDIADMLTTLDRIATALPPEGNAALRAASRRWREGSAESLEPWARLVTRLTDEATAMGEASRPATKALQMLHVVLDDDLGERAIDTFDAAAQAFNDSHDPAS